MWINFLLASDILTENTFTIILKHNSTLTIVRKRKYVHTIKILYNMLNYFVFQTKSIELYI